MLEAEETSKRESFTTLANDFSLRGVLEVELKSVSLSEFDLDLMLLLLSLEPGVLVAPILFLVGSCFTICYDRQRGHQAVWGYLHIQPATDLEGKKSRLPCQLN